MSTPAEHYAAAEVWIDRAEQQWNDTEGDPMLAAATAQACASIAQVHMTAAMSPHREAYPHAPIF